MTEAAAQARITPYRDGMHKAVDWKAPSGPSAPQR
jgi:hypothetical protein